MKKILYWLPSIIWMIVIFGFSNQKSLHISVISWQDFVLRKIAHILEYFILFMLYLMALQNSFKKTTIYISLLALFMAILYAVTDEFHQSFIAGREGRIRDVVIDTFGASLAWLIRRQL